MATKKPNKGNTGLNFKDEAFVSPDIVQKYKDLFYKLNPRDTDRFTESAIEWFRKRIAKDMNHSQAKILDAATYGRASANQSNQLVGKLYFYQYKAESPGWDDKKIYDCFPMVFFFGATKSKEGKLLLHGLNLHYLTPKERQILLWELLKVKSSKTIRPQTRLKLSWDIIKSVSSSQLYERAVHTYRADRFQSKLVEIAAVDWSIAVFLNLQKWVALDPDDAMLPSEYRTALRKKALGHAKKMK